ncbi:MAG: hypothetical protein HOK41_12910 [Nitrospina sp.]|nr:hypothetical protein [Nitrospina sp.]
MFNEVKIFDKEGKVKKVLSSKKLSKDYWNSFFQMGEPIRSKGKTGGAAFHVPHFSFLIYPQVTKIFLHPFPIAF